MLRALSCLLLVLPALSGCMDADVDPRPVSSESAQGAGDAAARRWDDDAELVGLAAIDPGPGTMHELEDDLASAEDELAQGREDGSLSEDEESALEGRIAVLRAIIGAGPSPAGDGRAAVWMHAYRNGDGDLYTVAVGGGRVLHAQEEGAESRTSEDGDDLFFEGLDGETPLGSWNLDSVAAAQAAADGDEAYRELMGTDNVTAIATLMRDGSEDEDDPDSDGVPYWLLFLEANDGEESVFLLVNADNGTVVNLAELLADMLLGRESGSQGGRFVAGVDATESVSFTLERTHGALAVRLDLQPPPPQPVTATLTAPDGSTRSWDVELEPAASAGGFVLLEDPAAGDYTVTLSAPLVPVSDWTVSWCTDGDGFTFFPFVLAPAACDDL